jgi:hypothetical protein
MRHGPKIIDFIRLDLLDDADDIGGISQITVVKCKTHIALVLILVKVINSLSVERRSTTLNPMNFVGLFEQEFGKVRSVLAGYASD